MNLRLYILAGSALYSLYEQYNKKIRIQQQMEAEHLAMIEKLLGSAKTLRYRFGDYLIVCEKYGKDLADKCLNLTMEDVEKMNLKFYLVTR